MGVENEAQRSAPRDQGQLRRMHRSSTSDEFNPTDVWDYRFTDLFSTPRVSRKIYTSDCVPRDRHVIILSEILARFHSYHCHVEVVHVLIEKQKRVSLLLHTCDACEKVHRMHVNATEHHRERGEHLAIGSRFTVTDQILRVKKNWLYLSYQLENSFPRRHSGPAIASDRDPQLVPPVPR